jgi:hypothetical protein
MNTLNKYHIYAYMIECETFNIAHYLVGVSDQ